jgi:hypothetical protein
MGTYFFRVFRLQGATRFSGPSDDEIEKALFSVFLCGLPRRS